MRLQLGLLLVEGREVAPLQVAVGRYAPEIVAQPRLLLHDLLPLGVDLRELALGLGDRLLQLQDPGQRLAGLGVELVAWAKTLIWSPPVSSSRSSWCWVCSCATSKACVWSPPGSWNGIR